MRLEFPQPHAAALGMLSSTAANDLIAFGYRLALRLDKTFTSLRRPSPASELGLVAHGVAEEVANAHLVQASTEDLPRQIAIEDAAGRRWQEPFTPELVSAAVAEVMKAHEYHERAESRGTLQTLARPAPDTCRSCPCRPVCEPYWCNLTEAWRHGSVAGTTMSESFSQTIEIGAASPADSRGRRWTVSAVPASVVTAAAQAPHSCRC